MSDTIIVTIIGGIFSLLAAYIAARETAKKTEQQIRINQAVMETKIDELTREVREHNNFAKRMPAVETQIEHLKESEEEHYAQINRRISDLHKV